MPRHLVEDELVVLSTFGGDWDASSGSFPAAADTGDIYHVSVAGTVDSIDFEVGDFLIAEVAAPSTTTFTGSWLRMEHNDPELARFKGSWAPSGGAFPGSGSAVSGSIYRASDSGTIDSITFAAGDLILALADNASAATYSGNWQRVVASAGAAATYIEDADGDTKIQVEETSDDDTIRFDCAGSQLMMLDSASGLTIERDIVFTNSTIGPVLESPDGTQWRISVNNAGAISASSV